MRKLLAAAGLSLLVIALVAPGASAHDTDEAAGHVWWASPTPSANSDVPNSDVANPIKLAVETDFNIKGWRIEVLTPAGHTYPGFGSLSTCDRVATRRITCEWDTSRYPGGGISVNGEYLLRASVTDDPGWIGSEHAHLANPRIVWVENAPADLAGLQRSFDSNSGQLTVGWAPNPEPDISRYVVQRYNGGTPDPASEQSVAGPSRCPNDGNRVCFIQSLSEPGNYRYRVSPVRFDGDVIDGVQQELEGFKWVDTEPFDLATAPEAPRSSGGDQPAGPADLGPEPGVNIPGDTPATTAPPAGSSGASSGAAPRPATSGGSSGGLFPRPAASKPVTRATTTTTEPDAGFTETLPYKLPQKGSVEDEEQELAGGEEPQTIEKFIEIPRPRDTRALLVPLAGGLTIFVFAMQMTLLMRRRPALASAEDDFGDWMGI